MTDDVSVGQVLSDRFEILALVGRGGMSAVYQARDELLGRIVAIKVFSVDSSGDRARLESEIRLLSRLRQPTLVTVYDAFLAESEAAGPSFLVMEFVEGKSLGNAIAERQLAAADIGRIAVDIGEALSAVHREGIIHRDVKPANILLEAESSPTAVHAKLADFGIAQMLDATRLTMPGTVIGTAAYLSPEQAAGADVGSPSDIYSLGLVLLEAFTRRREFPGTPAESLSARMARLPNVPIDLPAGWSELLGGMLALAPTARPTATEVVAAANSLRLEDRYPASASGDERTALLPTAEMPTRLLPPVPGATKPSAAIGRDDTPTARFTSAATATEPLAADRHRPHVVLIALAAVFVVAATALIIVLVARGAGPMPANRSGGSPSPTANSSSPSPSPAATSTPPSKGHGKGNGNGNGNGHNKNP